MGYLEPRSSYIRSHLLFKDHAHRIHGAEVDGDLRRLLYKLPQQCIQMAALVRKGRLYGCWFFCASRQGSPPGSSFHVSEGER